MDRDVPPASVRCIRCRREACRCERDALVADLLCLARILHLRREAERHSRAYVAWLDGGRAGPEPLVAREVRRVVRDLVSEADRLAAPGRARAL